MIATDTNILVYAHRADSQWHDRAKSRIEDLAHGRISWGLPWPCIHEFVAVATHPRIYDPASTLSQAIDQVGAWLESPAAVLLGETGEHWQVLTGLLQEGRVTGSLVHDARVAAICIAHGVTELWTADRDFSRFPGLAVRNPLQG
ncbi:MAG: type II toxin-antitoxin system VapC family toxin [Gammaproteobacteria bacterium]|nr:type II toxin-antitoxin system VapC family toxin [Gammaproteobacteria bacterium]MYF66183.1 type II toxin-antitoxin system VapC family toxin [Gammaproteobacteria bacterium]MYK38562.1 type II toxin-antitoxin system VapC family toxin [Gammaproteobacteria bacterium]